MGSDSESDKEDCPMQWWVEHFWVRRQLVSNGEEKELSHIEGGPAFIDGNLMSHPKMSILPFM